MKSLTCLLLSLPVLFLSSCDAPSSGLPGSVSLTIKASANCIGVVDTVDVKVNDLQFGTVVPGGDSFSKTLAPMRYEITAFSRNGAKQWSESRNLLSSGTFECGCP